MKAQKVKPVVVWALLALACHIPGECIVGQDASSCPANAFCYAGKNAKAGDRGICTQLSHNELPDDPLPDDPLPDDPLHPRTFPPDTLAILGFGPLEASHGTLLTIQGTLFSAVPPENHVTLNGVPATLVSAIPNEIKVIVPKTPLCSGPVRVTVAGKTVVSSTSFTYVPTVANVTTFVGSTDTAVLHGPCNIVMGKDGNFYVTDFNNRRIRQITPQGAMSTFAGTSSATGTKDGTGTNANFLNPCGITTDAQGYLYVTDGGLDNGRIRRISIETQQVTTLADKAQGFVQNPGKHEEFIGPRGIARDADGNLYVADTSNHAIQKISPEGLVLTFAGKNGVSGYADGQKEEARFNTPRGVTMDAAGNLYVADGSNSLVRKISPEGRVSTLSNGQGFVENPENAMSFKLPRSIAIDKTGFLYVVEMDGHRIQQITPSGKASIFAGTGTPGFAEGARTAQFSSPRELIIGPDGNFLLADYGNNRIRKIILE